MDDTVVKRIPPHSIEAEQSVLGCMLYSPEAINDVLEILQPEDFYQHQYGIIFATIVDLCQAGKPTDIVTVQNELKTKDVAPDVYSLDTLKNLLNSVFTVTNVADYAKIVAEKAQLRRIISSMEGLTDSCYMEKEKAGDLMTGVEKEIFRLMETRTDNPIQSARKVALNTLNEIQVASQSKDGITGVRSGFTLLDQMLTGFQPGDLNILAGRPSMGKTAFALNIAENILVKQGKPVCIFSLEMSREQLMKRMFSMLSHIDAQKLRRGDLNDAEWSELTEAAGVMADTKFIIDDTSGLPLGKLYSRARRYKMEYDIQLIIIDYMQMLTLGGKASDNRNQEMSEISRTLKSLARELKVPVIALSQLSRASDKRPDHRPVASDLRESGGIEQDADTIMFIYRDEVYNKDSDRAGIAEIIVNKQRNGPTGTIDLKWIGSQTRFANLEGSKVRSTED